MLSTARAQRGADYAGAGLTEQLNGLPACQRHNRFKERGYTVTRNNHGDITITTPTGDIVR